MGSLKNGETIDIRQIVLGKIPSLFGRLVHLSSLRAEQTGRYRHHGLSEILGDDEADKCLREMHEQVFAEWLNLRLEQQRAGFALYLFGQKIQRRAVRDIYQNLVPASVTEVDRRLYLTDLEVLLQLLEDD